MISATFYRRFWFSLLVTVLVGVAPVGLVHAAWVPCARPVSSTSTPAVMQWSAAETVLEFDLAGYDLTYMAVDGQICAQITMPDQPLRRDVGQPELPFTTRSLVVADRGQVRLEILEQEVREIQVVPVVPSRGHVLRDVDPATVVRTFGSTYRRGEIWPAEQIELGRPFILRDHRGVTVTFNPLRYDAGRGVLLVTEHLVLAVRTGGGTGANELTAPGSGSGREAFAPLYDVMFPDGGTDVTAAGDKYLAPASRGRLLMVADGALTGALEPLVVWKRQCGIDVEVITTAEAGGTAAGISQAIADRYAETDGLTWVILVGDKAQVPTHQGAVDGSDSDSIYAMQAGDDLYPDLYVSRISATNPDEVAVQVAKFIAYEKTPAVGEAAAWYGRAAGIASDEGSPSDFERAELLRTDLLAYGYSDVARIYQGFGGTRTEIAEAVDGGCSLINYLGHGSGTGWTSVPFGLVDVAGLSNDGRWPWIIDVSCSNGKFSLPECFAEAWLRAGTIDEPAGAVAMMSATSSAPWVPPTVMQAEVIDLLTRDAENRIGALYYSGLMKVLDIYGDVSAGQLVVEQSVVFGDCSLMVRSKAPVVPAVSLPDSIALAATDLAVTVDQPGAVVAVTAVGDLYGFGEVAADGTCTVTLTRALENLTSVTVTVTGYNLVPYQAALPVQASTTGTEGGQSDDADDDLVQPTVVQLLGNYPNPFNPQTRVVYELPADGHIELTIYDLRGRLQRVLLRGERGAGRHETVWDGRDDTGRTVPSGVYLCRLISDQGPMQVVRMTLAR